MPCEGQADVAHGTGRMDSEALTWQNVGKHHAVSVQIGGNVCDGRRLSICGLLHVAFRSGRAATALSASICHEGASRHGIGC